MQQSYVRCENFVNGNARSGTRERHKWVSGVNFTNILRAAFTRTDPKSANKLLNLTGFLRFWDVRA